MVHKEKSFYEDEAELEKFIEEAQLECDAETGECRLVESGIA